jgi:DNA-binding transcriptional regulator GbsR (MarR family)
MKDVWEMFRIIVEERKRREFDPTVEVVRECLAEANKPGGSDNYPRERMEQMLEFITTMSALFEEFRDLSPAAMKRVARLRGGIRKLLHG